MIRLRGINLELLLLAFGFNGNRLSRTCNMQQTVTMILSWTERRSHLQFH